MGYEIEAQTTMQNGMKARAKDTEDERGKAATKANRSNAETQRNAEKLKLSATLCESLHLCVKSACCGRLRP